MLYHLNKYTPKNPKYIEEKNNLVKKVEKFYEGRKKLLKGLMRKYFRLIAMKSWRKKEKTLEMKTVLSITKKEKTLEMKTVLSITKHLGDFLISKSET